VAHPSELPIRPNQQHFAFGITAPCARNQRRSKLPRHVHKTQCLFGNNICTLGFLVSPHHNIPNFFVADFPAAGLTTRGSSQAGSSTPGATIGGVQPEGPCLGSGSPIATRQRSRHRLIAQRGMNRGWNSNNRHQHHRPRRLHAGEQFY